MVGRLLAAAKVPWGRLLIAASDRPHPAREIAEAASRAGGAGGRVEVWVLDEALEELGDYAYALALNQRISSERARRILGWAPSAPSVFEELEGGSYLWIQHGSPRTVSLSSLTAADGCDAYDKKACGVNKAELPYGVRRSFGDWTRGNTKSPG